MRLHADFQLTPPQAISLRYFAFTIFASMFSPPMPPLFWRQLNAAAAVTPPDAPFMRFRHADTPLDADISPLSPRQMFRRLTPAAAGCRYVFT
jgi:hypothetical protein